MRWESKPRTVPLTARAIKHDDIVESILSGIYCSSSSPEVYSGGIEDGKTYITCSVSERNRFIVEGFVGSGIPFTTGSKRDLRTLASNALAG